MDKLKASHEEVKIHEQIVNKNWKSHEQVINMNKSWTNPGDEQVMKKSRLLSHEQVIKSHEKEIIRLWTRQDYKVMNKSSVEQVMRKSWTSH